MENTENGNKKKFFKQTKLVSLYKKKTVNWDFSIKNVRATKFIAIFWRRSIVCLYSDAFLPQACVFFHLINDYLTLSLPEKNVRHVMNESAINYISYLSDCSLNIIMHHSFYISKYSLACSFLALK